MTSQKFQKLETVPYEKLKWEFHIMHFMRRDVEMIKIIPVLS